MLVVEPLAKVFFVVRQAHHEREKFNKFNSTTVPPELVEGYCRSFARGSVACGFSLFCIGESYKPNEEEKVPIV